ncbi:RNA polymerase sigma-70 factor [Sphingobacterium olei]|uniref:RNA polymerase sigma-70 factor n=1 Tax=Sphingobacterium olei TaxID=2571155 RepID=A0A4U0PFG0_9SPHI|nr:RNA polymerase sigma-70 factor [Sphingobacterium olei]TJZ61514.1 RNA polymerase sigma-70 factor [Sphingobacterium olei]
MYYPTLDNESVLLRRVAEGHQASFDSIYRFYIDRVYSFALHIVKDKEWAYEIVQDVFMKLWQYGKELLKIENLYAWLRTIARNQALQVIRRRALEMRVEKELAASWKEARNTTDDTIFYNEAQRILDRAINQLTPQQRKVYICCHMEGCSYEEVASRLGLSKLTVQTHMKQALRSIRQFVIQNYQTIFLLLLLEWLN